MVADVADFWADDVEYAYTSGYLDQHELGPGSPNLII